MEAKNEVFDKQLVLVGGGHTHALLIRMLAQHPIPGVKTILVSDTYHASYSGTLPGYLAGSYLFDQSHIDLYRLCTWAGVEFVQGSVDGIDPKKKHILLKDYPNIVYDILSIDIGSTPKMADVPGAETFATGVKPVPQFLKVFHSMIESLETGKLTKQSIVIVGGGAAGVEVALGLRHRLAPEHDIHLVHKNSEVLNEKPRAVRAKFHKILVSSGVKLHLASPVVQVEKNSLKLENHQFNYDFLFWMTQASAAPWLQRSGLDLDQRGFIAVKDTLQTLSYENIFATGDIASQKAAPRPKAGVFAVRQAKPLAENLRLVFSGAKARAFKPQRQFLTIIVTGDGNAVAMRGPLSASGAWVWRWKVRIDQKFINQFANLPQRTGVKYTEASLEANGGIEVSQSTETSCAYSGFFPAIVEDPFLVGSIAAYHCANEILIRGIIPKSLSLDLRLSSGSSLVAESQQTRFIAGFRSGFETFGLDPRLGSVSKGFCLGVRINISGSMEPSAVLRKSVMQKGDVLILTKPLGTGLILTAARQLRAKGRWVEAAVQSMLRPGLESFALAHRHKVNATGYVAGTGLLGLLAEILRENLQIGTRVSVRLELASVPVILGALDCLRLGVESKQTGKNVDMVHKLVTVKPGKKASEHFPILFDPQTAGGLLFSVAAHDSLAMLKALHEKGDLSAAVIGRVEDAQDAQIYIE